MQALFECENEHCELGCGGTYDIPPLDDPDEDGFPPGWPICLACLEPMALSEVDYPDPEWTGSLWLETEAHHGLAGLDELIEQATPRAAELRATRTRSPLDHDPKVPQGTGRPVRLLGQRKGTACSVQRQPQRAGPYRQIRSELREN